VVPKGSGCGINKRTELSQNARGDVIVVDIKNRGEKITRIVNIYEEREGESGERPAGRLNWQTIIRQEGGGLAPEGDFSAQSQLWDPGSTERKDATYRENTSEEHRLVTGNYDWPTNHWMRHDSMRESLIDLTLANGPFGKWMILDRS